MSSIVAENERWRVRRRGEDWALTFAEGRFTLYLHGTMEKVAFVKVLESLRMLSEDIYFVAFGGYFGLWLTQEDVEFLLEALPLSDAERELAVEGDIVASTVQ